MMARTSIGYSARQIGLHWLVFLLVAYQWPVYGGILGLNFSNMGNGSVLLTSSQIFKIEI